jgi:dTDP-4-dehydrorhamnose 3,5-epimerase
MKVSKLEIPEVLLVEPKVFGDQRGYFLETFLSARYRDAGLPEVFVQDNMSKSQRGVLRGLHFQHPKPQGKLVMALVGEIFDVAVDVRRGSLTFGQWVGATLSEENHHQLYVPPGFAHGFCVTSEEAWVGYKCTAPYDPSTERSILFSDPAIGIDWPTDEPQLSEKDRAGVLLGDMAEEHLPRFEG